MLGGDTRMASGRKQDMRPGEDARMVAELKIAIREDGRIDSAIEEQLTAFLSYLIVDGVRPKAVRVGREAGRPVGCE